MRKQILLSAAVVALCPGLIFGQAGQNPSGQSSNNAQPFFKDAVPKKTEGPERPVQGIVRDEEDNPVEGAVVHLTNFETKASRAFITKKDGTYRFDGLKKNQDYEIRAEYRDLESPKRRLSSLDPAPKLIRNLKLEPKSSEEDEKDGDKKASASGKDSSRKQQAQKN